MDTFVTPPPLRTGDRVAIVAPSLSIDADRLDVGCRRLRETFDLEPVVFETARRSREWLLDHPEERARDVMRAFEDPSIRGIVASTGGDDQIRILKHLDGDGPVTGRVWGGCYEILSWHLQGGVAIPDPEDLDGDVLALEPSETLPYAADIGYTLRSMGERGLLQRFDGLLVGRPRSQTPGYRDVGGEEYRADIREAVVSQLREYNPSATAVFEFDFGHTDPHVPLPIGGEVTVDPGEETIRFD